MKKYDDGYALVLVVMVMAVLMLVALSVLSLSLRNLQSQQASIERMQAKYVAQGEIEKQIAELFSGGSLTLLANQVKSAQDGYLFVELTADPGNIKVVCTIQITGAINLENGKYIVTNPQYKYMEYTISTVAEATTPTGGDAG